MGKRNRNRAAVIAQDKSPTMAQVNTGESVKVMDAFANVLARLGTGTSNLMEGTQYPLTRLTRDYVLMQSLYRTSWIARKVIDSVPEDMLKNWVRLTGDMEAPLKDAFEKVIEATGTPAKILEALKWGRLFGGAGAVMVIDGHADMLDMPLKDEDIGPGSYRGLLVFDRWSGITPSSELVTDTNDPDFGLPEFYQCTTATTGEVFRVHHSRVLRFTGRQLPVWERQVEQGWGESELELIFDELRKRDNTSWSLVSLIFRANIMALKMPQLAQMLALSDGTNQAKALATLQSQNQLMSNQGLMILPADGELQSHQYSFGGVNDIYQSFMLDVCGASEIPMSRLFGRAPAGLSNTNEGDEQVYEDNLGQKQEREVRPQLRKAFRVVAISTWGEVPKDFGFEFMPIRSLNNKERSDLAKNKSEAIVSVFNAGLISEKTGMQELSAMSEETGMFESITDEQIDAANDQLQPKGEFGFGGETNPFDKQGGE